MTAMTFRLVAMPTFFFEFHYLAASFYNSVKLTKTTFSQYRESLPFASTVASLKTK